MVFGSKIVQKWYNVYSNCGVGWEPCAIFVGMFYYGFGAIPIRERFSNCTLNVRSFRGVKRNPEKAYRERQEPY